jgi:hypothetical protein
MATMGRVAKTTGSPPEGEAILDPVGLSRYHASANTALCIGIFTGLLFGSLNWLPAWGGFLAGAVPAFLLAAFAHALRDES